VTRRQEIDAMIYAHTGHQHADLAGAVDALMWQYEHKAKVEERDRIRARIGLWELEERQAEAQPAPVAGEEEAVDEDAMRDCCRIFEEAAGHWPGIAEQKAIRAVIRRVAQPARLDVMELFAAIVKVGTEHDNGYRRWVEIQYGPLQHAIRGFLSRHAAQPVDEAAFISGLREIALNTPQEFVTVSVRALLSLVRGLPKKEGA